MIKKIIKFLFLPVEFIKTLLWDIPMIEFKYRKEKNERLRKRN
jgi:hypothetical protein